MDFLLDFEPWQNYLDAWRKYADFKDSASRSQFWSFTLINLVFSLIIYIVTSSFFDNEWINDGISLLFQIIITVPSLEITVRRLHDTNRSGWFCLLDLLPIIGSLVLFIFEIEDGQPYRNKYGDDPKY